MRMLPQSGTSPEKWKEPWSPKLTKWHLFAAMGVNFACDVSCHQKSFLPGSKLASYQMESLKEHNKFDYSNTEFPLSLQIITKIPKCLQGLQMKFWDRGDMIDVRCLEEDENMYVKPFRIGTAENVYRETAPEIMSTFRYAGRLGSGKTATIKAYQLQLQLEREFTHVNTRNQLRGTELQHRQALKTASHHP